MSNTSAASPSLASAADDAATPTVPHGAQGDGKPDSDADSDSDSDDYGELRQLLLAPEQEEIDALRRALQKPNLPAPESVAAVLPAAFTLANEGDKALSEAMLPLVESSIAQSVRQQPEVIAEAIFPIIGTAISRAVREAFLRMMQQTTYAMENAFSLRSWRWRLEARATGKPFSEVVLLHSLVYRVEQVFLIQPESGLLMQHVFSEALDATSDDHGPDASMVSSMLTAIQAYVHDSFRIESKAALDSIEVGELTVWIERGPQAVLASVIRGTAPLSFRSVLRGALESCHRECKQALRSFSGNTDDLKATRAYLLPCLQSQLQPKPKRSPLPFVIVGLVFAALFGLLGWRIWIDHLQAQHFARALEKLRRQPGVVVISAERHGRKQSIFALRDPEAHSEFELLAEAGLTPADTQMTWRSFLDGDADIVVRRAQHALRPPPSVQLNFADGMLTASGSALPNWIDDARLMARMVPGVRAFHSTVKPLPRPPDLYDILSARARRIEAIEIRFRAGTVELLPGQEAEVQRAVDEMREILKMAANDPSNLQVTIEIRAYTDDIGNELYNLRLRESRAKLMAHWLASAGVDERHLRTVAPLEFERERSARAASFRIVITASPHAASRVRAPDEETSR